MDETEEIENIKHNIGKGYENKLDKHFADKKYLSIDDAFDMLGIAIANGHTNIIDKLMEYIDKKEWKCDYIYYDTEQELSTTLFHVTFKKNDIITLNKLFLLETEKKYHNVAQIKDDQGIYSICFVKDKTMLKTISDVIPLLDHEKIIENSKKHGLWEFFKLYVSETRNQLEINNKFYDTLYFFYKKSDVDIDNFCNYVHEFLGDDEHKFYEHTNDKKLKKHHLPSNVLQMDLQQLQAHINLHPYAMHLLRDGYLIKGTTCFINAIEKLKFDIIRFLMKINVNVQQKNKKGESALVVALENNYEIRFIEYLLNKGANPNDYKITRDSAGLTDEEQRAKNEIQNPEVDVTNNPNKELQEKVYGLPAYVHIIPCLSIAIKNKNYSAATLLLQKGADPNFIGDIDGYKNSPLNFVLLDLNIRVQNNEHEKIIEIIEFLLWYIDKNGTTFKNQELESLLNITKNENVYNGFLIPICLTLCGQGQLTMANDIQKGNFVNKIPYSVLAPFTNVMSGNIPQPQIVVYQMYPYC